MLDNHPDYQGQLVTNLIVPDDVTELYKVSYKRVGADVPKKAYSEEEGFLTTDNKGNVIQPNLTDDLKAFYAETKANLINTFHLVTGKPYTGLAQE